MHVQTRLYRQVYRLFCLVPDYYTNINRDIALYAREQLGGRMLRGTMQHSIQLSVRANRIIKENLR